MATLLGWEHGVLYGQSNSKSSKAPLEASQQHLGESDRTSEATRVSPRLVPADRGTAAGENIRMHGQEEENNRHIIYTSCVDTITDRAQGSLRPLAASLCCVVSSGVPAVFHCCQSGMDILPWPWSPPMLRANTDICKLTFILNGNYHLVCL